MVKRGKEYYGCGAVEEYNVEKRESAKIYKNGGGEEYQDAGGNVFGFNSRELASRSKEPCADAINCLIIFVTVT